MHSSTGLRESPKQLLDFGLVRPTLARLLKGDIGPAVRGIDGNSLTEFG